MKFQNKVVDLGTIKQKTTHTVSFYASEDLPKGVRLGSSCGCSVPRLIGDREIQVTYKAGSVPLHLIGEGYFKTSKTIYVAHPLFGQEELYLTATVTL